MIRTKWIAGGAVAALALVGCQRTGEVESPAERTERMGEVERDEDRGMDQERDRETARTGQQDMERDREMEGARMEHEQRLVIVPGEVVGHSISGTAMVDEVLTGEGFYVTDGQTRMLVLIPEAERGQEQVEVEKGDIVYLEGLVLEQQMKDEIQGDIDPRIDQALDREPFFVAADANRLEVLGTADQQAMQDRRAGEQMPGMQGEQMPGMEGEQMPGMQGEQMPDMGQAFRQADQDESGKLEEREFTSHLVQQHVLPQLDQDGDSRVSEHEFQRSAKDLGLDLDVDDDGKYDDEFIAFDWNNDGYLDADEIGRTLFRALDQDDDNAIGMAEIR